MVGNRFVQMQSDLEEKFGEALQHELNDRDVMVSVTRSKLARDYSFMTIFLSIYPTSKRGSTFSKIKKILPDIQFKLFKKAGLKYFPTFAVTLDDSFEYGDRILNLIDQATRKSHEFDDRNDSNTLND